MKLQFPPFQNLGLSKVSKPEAVMDFQKVELS